MRHHILLGGFAVLALAVVSPVSAAVVVGPNIGGYATFTDTNTGRDWVRMDSFFNKSHFDMKQAVQAAGFTVAVWGDVNQLLSTLPLPDAATWDGYAAIMGRAPNRALIWGSFDPINGNGMIDWAFASRGAGAWTAFNFQWPAFTVPNGGSGSADMNIWAYSGGGNPSVPEPAAWALMISGFGLMGMALRRRRTIPA